MIMLNTVSNTNKNSLNSTKYLSQTMVCRLFFCERNNRDLIDKDYDFVGWTPVIDLVVYSSAAEAHSYLSAACRQWQKRARRFDIERSAERKRLVTRLGIRSLNVFRSRVAPHVCGPVPGSVRRPLAYEWAKLVSDLFMEGPELRGENQS